MIKVWPPIVSDFERLARSKGLSLVKLRGDFLKKKYPTYRDRKNSGLL